ncbi:MAG: cyclopropane-fatty-acyl-phospholipid synthase [Curvibacter sp. RIFCSPHIGHO2_12_FULL_63_18]|uniref:SAM-dependent methyltransferase n=1 Tax=Rhodoferax sp. TaxID=50421 RepID=UPI0008B6B6D0|nr:cyclopropane-fatty-acyl-phospholipid synthase family protein [Rhodoferax sp.]OGO94716.1 MAG: cyclopropane-fatty-acyl-phospholipid synthase [Curvibacter sp. GWA2_63_95]OGP06882.1 MAG: cyclopropane-fatty-acyl-phospholipid synthase [Curvibacter sp. RIFCSPHIGHO2_12_FULL_63_18]HCX80212.1 SAM-dependent methyltransferase [Rhodoferax sp.]
MNTNSVTSGTPTFVLPRGTPAAARTVFRLLQSLRHGSLSVQLPDGSTQRFGGEALPHASIQLHNWNVCSAAIKSGDIGFAETFIAGDWSTPNLTELLRVLVKNRAEVEGVIYGTWVGRLFYRIKHLLNRNTKANSQKNIHAHYDLGNTFYTLWLDETMNYSSALFAGNTDQPMAEAQKAKVRRALSMAGVQPGDRVLEIGCGWGALAEMATTEFNASITGVTLSTEQLAFARERMQRLGVPNASDAGPPQGVRVTADLRLQDYRDIADAPFDAVCSIEMVEAVGREYWSTYFASVAKLLKPGGRACVQSIVIDDALFDRYITSTDFIQQYIFPGGCLPCPREFRAQARAAGLEVVDEYAFGPDYAETLRRWRDAFLAERERVMAAGFDPRFMRIWEFYLAYCEAAFDEHNIDVVQYTLQKRAT